MAVTSTTSSNIMQRVAANQAASGGASTNTASGSSTDQTTLNANFDMFLQLLTAQLRNQSPLDPMKPEQFSQQLTQYSAVEQQIKTNTMLERLITSQNTSSATAAISFLGADAVARGTAADLRSGQATWSLNAAAAGTADITVRDSSGAVVRTETRALTAGQNTYNWDGRNQNGSAQAEGRYTISVTARSPSGAALTVDTSARGRVTAVDFSGAEPMLTIAGARVKLSDVTSVSRTSGS